MNKKQLTNSVIVLVVLAVIAFFTMKKDSRTWQSTNEFEKQKLFENLDVNRVEEFIITTDFEKLELKKSEKGKWEVKNRSEYPANFTKLSNFLLSLKELVVVQEPRLIKNQFGTLKLEKPVSGNENKNAGSLLELKDRDGKTMLSLIVGQQHFPKQENSAFQNPQPDGCYVLIEGTDKPALITDPLDIVNPDPTKWIDPDFIRMSDILSLTLKESDGKEIYRIYRTDLKSPWILAGIKEGEIPLPRPMRDATSTFERISFDDVLPSKDIDFKDAKTAVIETAQGIIYDIRLLKKDKKVFAKLAISAKATSKIPQKDVTPEELKKAEEKAINDLEKLKKTIEKQFFFTKWVYEFPSYKIDKVLKDKVDFYKGDI